MAATEVVRRPQRWAKPEGAPNGRCHTRPAALVPVQNARDAQNALDLVAVSRHAMDGRTAQPGRDGTTDRDLLRGEIARSPRANGLAIVCERRRWFVIAIPRELLTSAVSFRSGIG